MGHKKKQHETTHSFKPPCFCSTINHPISLGTDIWHPYCLYLPVPSNLDLSSCLALILLHPGDLGMTVQSQVNSNTTSWEGSKYIGMSKHLTQTQKTGRSSVKMQIMATCNKCASKWKPNSSLQTWEQQGSSLNVQWYKEKHWHEVRVGVVSESWFTRSTFLRQAFQL